MKILSVVFAAALVVAPNVGLAGEEERNTQLFGSLPDPLPELTAIPDDATAALVGLGALGILGGAAAGIAAGGGGGGGGSAVGTTSTTSTTSTTGTTP